MVEWKLFCQYMQRTGKEEKMLAQVENESIRSGDNSRIKELKADINVLFDREAWM